VSVRTTEALCQLVLSPSTDQTLPALSSFDSLAPVGPTAVICYSETLGP
jgi:hypothetical protein